MGNLKPLTEQFVKALADASGAERLLWLQVDYSSGLRENDKHDWSLWLVGGERVDIAVGIDGGWVMSIVKDYDKPNLNKE